MKKYIVFLLLILSSCFEIQNKQPERDKIYIEGVDINDCFGCSLLFEKDGVKIYRFFDKHHWHYFTSKEESISTYKFGKNSYYQENIK